MDAVEGLRVPAALPSIVDATLALRFPFASNLEFGPLLRMLAASKPGGNLLELGTGTGVGTSWLLDGMDGAARLVSVDRNPDVQAIAKKHLGGDRRVTFVLADGADYLRSAPAGSVDLLFADGGAGKGNDLDLGLRVLRAGGIYIGDDLRQHLLQEDGRAARMRAFEAALQGREDFAVVKLDWSSGVILGTRRVSPSGA